MGMADQLSGVAIIICIAFGVLTFLLLFIFANRQIKRFSLKSRSGPHAPTAADASKAMQQEIDRRFDVVKSISYRPKLLGKEAEAIFTDTDISSISPPHLYRMKVLDSITELESNIVSSDPTLGLLFSKDLRLCLVRLFQRGLVHRIEITVLHSFADLYESARHEPGDFGSEKYVQFMQLLNQVQQSISPQLVSKTNNNNKHFATSSTSSSNDMEKHMSNGKLSTLPITVTPPDDDDEEENEEKKLTYETSV